MVLVDKGLPNCMGTLSHFMAGLGTLTASFGAGFTMVMVMLAALSRAGFAQMSTQFADISRVSTPAGHK